MRKKLIDEGYFFRSHSDTEVLLKSYIEWGTNCVDYLNGIFAFAVWDKKNRSLFMARDRLGVKPLFYTRRGKNIIFASEIKALLEHPQVFPIIDDVGLMQIFGLGPARPSNSGIFKDILELPPAHYLYITPEFTTMYEYWKLKSKPHEDNVSQTLSHIRNLFEITVKNQLIADVPVCTFLSGECADEIFGGYPWFSRLDMIEANTFPWSQALDERYDLLHRYFKHLKLIEYVQS